MTETPLRVELAVNCPAQLNHVLTGEMLRSSGRRRTPPRPCQGRSVCSTEQVLVRRANRFVVRPDCVRRASGRSQRIFLTRLL